MELHGSYFELWDEKSFQGRLNISRVDGASNMSKHWFRDRW